MKKYILIAGVNGAGAIRELDNIYGYIAEEQTPANKILLLKDKSDIINFTGIVKERVDRRE